MTDSDFLHTRTFGSQSGSPVNGWNGRQASTLKVSVYAKVDTTGEQSATQTIDAASVQFATIANAPYNSTATTPLYALPPPAAPQIAALGSGSATINYFASVSPRASHIELFEGTTNNFALATQVVNVANANGSYAASGTVGQTKYYWARAKNTADGKFGPVSNVLLVGF